MMHIRALTIIAMLAAPFVVGCDDAESTTESSSEETTGESWEKQVASIKKDLKARHAKRKTRIVSAKSLGISGSGKERSFRFTLTNDSSKTIDWAQAWVYYYDASGKCVGRYPHSITPRVKAGASKELALGHKGKRLKSDAVTADVEVTAVKWAGGKRWDNENLVQNVRDRTPGGLSHKELMAHEGDKVVGRWTGERGKDDKPIFQLTNISSKALTIKTLWVYYYGADGKVLSRDVANVSLELAAGATIEHEAGSEKAKMKDGVKHIEPSVSKVKVSGAVWENRNLADHDRPMRAKASS